MEPLKLYVICTNPRSGSWLLANGLERTGVAGKPHEWFNKIDEEEERQRCRMPPLEGAIYATYLAWIKQAGTSLNGVFGMKLMYYQFAELPQKLSAIPAFTGVAAEDILTTAFPNLKHLWLIRRDKVRQAISHYRAEQTDLWWQIEGEQNPRRPSYVEKPCFDADAIAKFEQMAISDDLGWKRYFQQAGITPLEIIYEELAADYAGTIRCVLRWLGVSDAEAISIQLPRLKKQADMITEEWVNRYLVFRNRLIPVPCTLQPAIPSEKEEQQVGEKSSDSAPADSMVAVLDHNDPSPAAAVAPIPQGGAMPGCQKPSGKEAEALAKQGRLVFEEYHFGTGSTRSFPQLMPPLIDFSHRLSRRLSRTLDTFILTWTFLI